MQQINIRYASASDANDIAKVHIASWQKIYRGLMPDHVLDHLSEEERADRWLALIQQNVKVLIIEKNHQIAGFASICPARDADMDKITCGEISAIYLHPDFWHQGLGRTLCQSALEILENAGFDSTVVWVLEENHVARTFYEKMGFENASKKEVRVFDGVPLEDIRYQIKLKNQFAFKPLQKKDLDLLCAWVNKPHVKAWWNDHLSHTEIIKKYGERIDDEIVVPFIVYFKNQAIGFIQYYQADKVGEGWWPDEVEGTLGIDQFIGEEAFINKGYGTKMIKYFCQQLFTIHHAKTIMTDVDPANARAIKCYEKAGFILIGKVNTPDGLAYLMKMER